jgi:hypothetical protein
VGVESKDIKNIFYKRHYYTFTTIKGERSDALERDFLQILDGQIAEFIDDMSCILREGKRPVVDQSTVGFLRQFIYFHMKRNPDFEKGWSLEGTPKQLVDSAIEEYQSAFGLATSDKIEELTKPDKIDEIYHRARVLAYTKINGPATESLSKMSVHFAFPPRNKQFIIASQPVVRFENRKGATLGDGNVELWTPLTPYLLMGFCGPGSGAPQFLSLDERHVRKVNQELFRSSSCAASGSHLLLKSIVQQKYRTN